MFTGIVEEMGTVLRCERQEDMKLWDGSTGVGWLLEVRSSGTIMPNMYVGCSIAVNGTCLTVTKFDVAKKTFEFNFTLETARLTNLPELTAGSLCNLERSMKMGDGRNSGHFVQGHVDETGTVLSRKQEGAMVVFKISLKGKRDSEGVPLMRYVVSKGYVALDGTSLTVCLVHAKEEWFTIMMVPHTLENVVTGRKQAGDVVNVEVDVMGKYVHRSLGGAIGEEMERVAVAEKRASKAEGIAMAAMAVAVVGLSATVIAIFAGRR